MLRKSIILLLAVLTGLNALSQKGSLSELDPFLKKSLPWRSQVLGRDVQLKIYFKGARTTNPDGEDVIIYLKNKAWERIGLEPDLSILNDYINSNNIVITLGYGNDPKACSPFIDPDFYDLVKAVYGFRTRSLLADLGLKPNEFRCFFLPEGYRVARNLVYWEIDKHAVFGTMEYIMKSYNEDIVPKYPGLKPVSSPGEMTDRKGKPFDYSIKMDIIYPSKPKKKLPVIVFSDYLANRNPNSSPNNYLPHFAGCTTRGYVYADMGHCFNPCVAHFFHFSRFTLDEWNGYACYTAAIRFLRANAGKYGMNTDYIGVAGISKGEYSITRLSDPHHETRKEEAGTYDGYPAGSPEPQPWQGYSSRIQAGMQGMGMGLFESQFLTADYIPNLIVCGEHDRDVITEAHHKFVNKLEELDANYIDLFMKDLGHEFPHGYDTRMGVDRYQLFCDFFDRYLKVPDKLPPVALVVYPFNNEKDIPVTSEIYIQFAPVLNEQSILLGKGIKIIRLTTGKEVTGNWIVSHQGTKFTFKPEKDLQPGERYKITLTPLISDKAGTMFAGEKSFIFSTAIK